MIFLIILIAVAVFWVVTYNGLVQSRMHTKETWSQIDVQLQRRNDLIPNLVSTVKGYSKFEQGTLEKVVGLRNQLAGLTGPNASPDNAKEAMEVSNQLSTSVKGIFAVAEAYPELKANTQYMELMEELSNTENKIAYSRQLFNSSTGSYNGQIQSFPSNIVAKVHHFEPAVFLETPAEERKVVKVSFDD